MDQDEKLKLNSYFVNKLSRNFLITLEFPLHKPSVFAGQDTM